MLRDPLIHIPPYTRPEFDEEFGLCTTTAAQVKCVPVLTKINGMWAFVTIPLDMINRMLDGPSVMSVILQYAEKYPDQVKYFVSPAGISILSATAILSSIMSSYVGVREVVGTDDKMSKFWKYYREILEGTWVASMALQAITQIAIDVFFFILNQKQQVELSDLAGVGVISLPIILGLLRIVNGVYRVHTQDSDSDNSRNCLSNLLCNKIMGSPLQWLISLSNFLTVADMILDIANFSENLPLSIAEYVISGILASVTAYRMGRDPERYAVWERFEDYSTAVGMLYWLWQILSKTQGVSGILLIASMGGFWGTAVPLVLILTGLKILRRPAILPEAGSSYMQIQEETSSADSPGYTSYGSISDIPASVSAPRTNEVIIDLSHVDSASVVPLIPESSSYTGRVLDAAASVASAPSRLARWSSEKISDASSWCYKFASRKNEEPDPYDAAEAGLRQSYQVNS